MVNQTEVENLLRSLIALVLSFGVLISCTPSEKSIESIDHPYNIKEHLATPRIFGQGTISTELPEFSTAFTQDGKKVHFNIASPDRKTLRIVESSFENGKWSNPSALPFSDGTYRDVDPFVSPEGSRLYFSSNRPRAGSAPKSDFDTWYAEKENNGWSNPINPGSPLNSDANEVFVSMTRDGILYFSSDANHVGRNEILRSRFSNGIFSEPEQVDLSISKDISLGNPYISLDGRLLVFATSDLGEYGGSDLYASLLTEEGWSKPVNLGERINSPQSDFAPCISPNGRYLFFTSERPGIVAEGQVQGRPPGDIYQVDLPVIDSNQLFRNAHAMAYDDQRERIVLFGGAGISKVYGETWEWENNNWVRVSTAGPAPRTFAAMTYDGARKQIVLFGGNRVLFGNDKEQDTFLNDTWTWDGKEWKKIAITGPSGRAEAGMAFDQKRGRIVLFGGYNRSNGEINRWGDTWEWDGAKWQSRSVQGPSPQSGTSIVYDELRSVVVFWGQNAERTRGETWEWDGQQWTQIRTAVSDRRYNAAMTYDKAKNKVIRFGGWDGKRRTSDTWEYSGISWTKIDTSGPAARNHSAMVYEVQNNRSVLFGGHDGENVFGDTWAFDGQHWALLREMAPIARLANGH